MLPSHIQHIKGKQNGPSICILGGTHGDEAPGVQIIKMLADYFDNQINSNQIIRGDLYFGLGNPAAVKQKSRSASGDRDLNRCFTTKTLARSPKTIDEKRAHEIAPLLSKMDYVIDLHSTSLQSPRFVCFGKNVQAHQPLIQNFSCRYILTDPNNVLPSDFYQNSLGTTDDFVDRHGRGVGICYETGTQASAQEQTEVLNEILCALSALGMIKSVDQDKTRSPEAPVYALSQCITAPSNQFIYAASMELGWQIIKAGQIVGQADNQLICIPKNIKKKTMYLFPRRSNDIISGRALFYLAERRS